MDIGMVGLGKMGANMVERLLKGGHRVVAYDINEAAVQAAQAGGAVGGRTLDELVQALGAPRSVWLMVPSGKITDDAVAALLERLAPGDTLLDGGNSYYKDSQRHAALAAQKGVHFIDVGTSGGIWGLKEGYCLMVGGDPADVERHRTIFETLAPAPDHGWGRVGPVGAGHFVKMIHNGIEYGLMQAYAEGFEIMKARQEFGFSLEQIAEIWRYGSVVRSWLLDLIGHVLSADEDLKGIKAWVPDSGEGRWTAFEAIDLNVSAPIITLSLDRRIRSREEEPFSDKLLSALRHEFGGHEVKKE